MALLSLIQRCFLTLPVMNSPLYPRFNSLQNVCSARHLWCRGRTRSDETLASSWRRFSLRNAWSKLSEWTSSYLRPSPSPRFQSSVPVLLLFYLLYFAIDAMNERKIFPEKCTLCRDTLHVPADFSFNGIPLVMSSNVIKSLRLSEVSLYRILCMRRSSSTKRTNHETFYIRKDDTWKCTG